MTWIASTLPVAIALLLPPLLLGVIARTKAFFAGRCGPPLLQVYFDILKLLRKDLVISSTATWVFSVGPAVTMLTALLATLLLPLGGDQAVVSFQGDVVLFAYLFGLGRFFTMASALDTGSAFEGMGAAREAAFSCLGEVVLFLCLATLATRADTLSLAPMLTSDWSKTPDALVLVAIALFVLALAENCRIPVDDPNTHLELTMIHEVMVLDHSGPLFALVKYGAALKLFAFGSLLVRVALPLGREGALVGWSVFVGGLLAFAVGVGVTESIMARLRLRNVPNLLIAAAITAALALILSRR